MDQDQHFQILQTAFDLAPLGCLVAETKSGAVVACNRFLLDLMAWALDDVLVADVRSLGLGSGPTVLHSGGRTSIPVNIDVRTPARSPSEYTYYFVAPGGGEVERDRTFAPFNATLTGFFEAFGDLGEVSFDASARTTRLTLSAREQKLVRQLRSGMTNQDIAFESNRSISTVKVAISNLYRRLGVSSRLELLNWLQGKGIL